MHNISEWVIAIPRAMLTIALIPPILKYVFHVEKKPKAQKEVTPQIQTNKNNVNSSFVRITPSSMNDFIGGLK